MLQEKIVIRALLRHYWKKGLSTRAAVKEICAVEGDNMVSKSAAAEWFKRFNEGDLSLDDKKRCGRPTVLNDVALVGALNEEKHASTRSLAMKLRVCNKTVHNHLHHLNYKLKRPRQDPYDLTDAQAKKRVEICQQLLKNPTDDHFWRRIVTNDEKWIYFVNNNRLKQWVKFGEEPEPVIRQDRFGKKVMLSVWWNYQGVLHYEFIPEGHAVNAELYCQQLDRVYNILKDKYPALVNRNRVLLQFDNAPCHRACLTQRKIGELSGVEVLPHPPYSPDVAPSDYGLFRSMQHFLCGRRFTTLAEVEQGCQEFFASKDQNWYFQQIRLLVKRWQLVIDNGGLYFDE